jgi:hypothetical protein
MKKRAFIFMVVLSAGLSGFSQSKYQSAVGIRVGSGYADVVSASYKTFIGESPSAVEFNLGIKPGYGAYDVFNLSLAATYQYHFPIAPVDGLQWFIGGGLIGYRSFSSYSGYRGFGLGIYPTGGVDYKFGNIPLNLSADLRPTIRIAAPEFYDYSNFYFGNFAVSARYTLR